MGERTGPVTGSEAVLTLHLIFLGTERTSHRKFSLIAFTGNRGVKGSCPGPSPVHPDPVKVFSG
jgi:hypothetical protein